jgi:hypothetical protein
MAEPDKIDELMMEAQDLDLRARKLGLTVVLLKLTKPRKAGKAGKKRKAKR